MRVLWLCNIMLPAFAKMVGEPYTNREGWLTGSFERLIREKKDGSDSSLLVELGVCCPVPAHMGNCHLAMDVSTGRQADLGQTRGIVEFFGFQEDLDHPEIYDRDLEERFSNVIRDFEPDIVHIFGTEFPHTLAMVKAFDHPERTLIGLQGMCCAIAEAYMAELPYSVQKARTFRDRVKHDSLKEQQEKFRKRARIEAEAISRTAHVTGRTSFDRNTTSKINPDALYHVMNETMRSPFYTGSWDPESEGFLPRSIFLSQGDYPLKGFHFMLEAMPKILERFPDTHLYVAGTNILGKIGGGQLTGAKRYPEAVWISAYGRYLEQLIRKYHLQGHVTMLGKLTAGQMKERFLDSNVFVCPSIMENSPNSLCEAMLLGMPVVAAKVGGIGDLVDDGEDGILFPGGKSDELAEGVITVFCEEEMAELLGKNAKAAARIRHNPDTNYRRLLEIYRSLA